MNSIAPSELILNEDKSVYHLHLHKNDIAGTIITVGDPERVDIIAKHLVKIRVKKRNREFYTITGEYKGKDITIISTGIGTDNIDIVFNELNILNKIDVETRSFIDKPENLTILRIGTSGTLREEIPLGSLVISKHAIGLEGLMNFYPINYNNFEKLLNKEITKLLSADFPFLHPYVVSSSEELMELFGSEVIQGITATCQGFYHPQGRFLWTSHNISILETLRKLNLEQTFVSNFEMETSGILGLAKYFGFKASSISLILANRVTNNFIENGEKKMEELIELCLEKLSSELH